jgi:Tol biopolymer transport system component
MHSLARQLTIILLLLSLVACATGGASQEKVAFLHITEQQLEIYTASPDGSNLHLVSSLFTRSYEKPGLDFFPLRWSPNGESIAWIDLWGGLTWIGTLNVLNVEEGTIEEISSNAIAVEGQASYLHWSPDGSQLVYCEREEENNELRDYLVLFDVNSGESTRIALDIKQVRCDEIQWSPNGDFLAVIDGNEQILIYDSDDMSSAQAIELTDWLLDNQVRVCNLAWSPDSTEIAFATGCGNGPPLNPPTWYEVYILTLDTGVLQPVANIMEREEYGRDYSAYLSGDWLDSKFIMVYALSSEPISAHPRPEISREDGIIVYDTSTMTWKQTLGVLAPFPLPREEISISSNGHVVWHSANGWEFYSITQNGQITDYRESLDNIPVGCWPQWSRDGTMFTFTETEASDRCSGDERGVFVYNTQTEDLVEVTKSLGGDNLLLGWVSEH